MTAYIVPRRRGVCLTHRPFQGAKGAKIYAGLGTADLIRYRSNHTFCGRCPPVTGDFSNDVSLASVVSPTVALAFTAPPAWFSRNDIWLQVRTYASDLENETLYRPRRVSLDGAGNLLALLVGTYVLLGVDPGDGGSPAIRFSWNADSSSLPALQFSAFYVSGTTNPGTVTVGAGTGRVQRLQFSGLAAGTYSFHLKAVNGATSTLLGTVGFTVAGAPTTTGAATIAEN